MNKWKKWILTAALLLLALAAAILSRCGNGDISVSNFFSGDETETSYDIRIAICAIDTLNPAVSKNQDSYQIGKLIYSGLFRLDKELVPQPDLAVSYRYGEDRKSVNIVLRSGVTWHDGEEFTADDVRFTIEAYQELARTSETVYAPYVANIRSVETNGSHEVTINFGSDAAVGMENLVFPILPSHLYKNAQALRSAGADFEPVGTGAYCVEEFNPLKQIVLSANEQYYGARAGNRMIFTVLPNRNDGVNLTEIQDVMLVASDAYERDTLIANRDLLVCNYPSDTVEMLVFNCAGRFSSNQKLRQAIACLIDSEEILKNIYYKNGVLTDSLFCDGFYGTENKGEMFQKDAERAQELLTEAGFRDRDENGYLDDKNGEELVLTLLVNADDPLRSAAADFIKRSIEQSGIVVNVDFADAASYAAKLAARDYDLLLAGCRMNERYDLRSLLHSAYANPALYSSETADRLTTELVSGDTREEKAKTVRKLKDLLTEELPYYPLFRKTNGLIYVPELSGELTPMFHEIYHGCEGWNCVKKIEK